MVSATRSSSRDSVQQVEDALPDIVRRQQVFERVAVQQRRSLVVFARPIDLDPEDLPGNLEDLPDPERLDGLVIEDLHPQRVDDSIASVHAVRDRIQRVVGLIAASAEGPGAVASITAEQLECSRRFHGETKHTVRRSADSSMNQTTSGAPQTTCANTLMGAHGEKARDRRQIQRVVRREGDAKDCVVVPPPGRTEQGEVERLP